MEGVGGGLRMGGGGGTVDHRVWMPGQAFISGSCILLRCLFCCRLDVMQTLLAAAHTGPALSPVCPVCPDRPMHWAKHVRKKEGGV